MSCVDWVRRSENRAIAEVIMRRERVLNAFDSQMARDLTTAFNEIVAEEDIRVVGLRSSTAKAFCTGADLKERDGLTEEQWREQHHLFERMFYTLADLPIPTIAVIDGFCLAGGMELALNCDMWVVSAKAVFGLPEVTRGIMPGGGASRLLSKRIGVHLAKEMILTGQKYDALAVAQMGLVNRLVAAEQLEEAFLELALPIAENAPLSMKYCKAAIDELTGLPDNLAREREISWYNRVVDTEDRREGIKAFNEKRKPQFKGR